MKKIMLIFVLIASVNINFVYSQETEIKGRICDSVYKTPIPYTLVVLKNDKDSIINGAISNENGDFIIKKINPSAKYLYIKCMGYYDKNILINEFKLSKNSKIYLGQSQTILKGAEISAKPISTQVLFDRKSYSISDAKASSSLNIFDILRTIPGIVIDENNNIKAKGMTATIYVDDQPSQFIYPKIEMMPTSNIYKIEVIDASTYGGNTGAIINIKMKQTLTDGLSGVLSGSGGTIDTKQIDKSKFFSNLNFKAKKIVFFNNFNVENIKKYNNSYTDGLLSYNNNSFQQSDTMKQKSKSNQYFDMLGCKSITQKTLFLFGIGLFGNNNATNNQAINSLSLENNPYDKYRTNEINKSQYKGGGASLFFLHYLDSLKRSIKASISFQNNTNNDKSNTLFYQLFSNGLNNDSTPNFNVNSLNVKNTIFSDILFNCPFKSDLRWNVGLSSIAVLNLNDDEKYYREDVLFKPNSKRTKVSSQDHNLFSRFGGTYKKWKFDGGINMLLNTLDANYMRCLTNLKDTTISIRSEYTLFQPSATISYPIDSLQDIKISYTKTENTPDYYQLCEFIDKSSSRNWSVGNSNLKPVQFHNFYLGYSINKDAWNFSSEAFYSITNNEISNINYLYNEFISINKPVNIASKRNIGIDLSSWFLFKKKHDVNISGSLFHSIIEANSFANNYEVKKKNIGYNIKLSFNGKINKTTSYAMFVNYISKEITLNGYDYSYINSSINITKKLFNNKWYISLGIKNLFDDLTKNGSYTNYMGINQTTIEDATFQKRLFFIGIQYNLNKGDRGTKDYKVGK
ncbi:MAG: TonB-dependent receptor [Bacteroidota bacterium]